MKGKQISAQVLGMALAGIFVWALGAFAKIAIPAEIAVAFGTVFSIGASLLIPDNMEASE